MASSARKKQEQDEKNLKILRELVALPGNKHCFDCNQRGPTYVNMTIGSFVCTKCSGILRGLHHPPHRVKSISMASFTADEIDLVKSRGNDYCRQTWLALYDQPSTENTDELDIEAFMIKKYEDQRYYQEKSIKNGTTTPVASVNSQKLPETKPLHTLLGSQTTSNIKIKAKFTNGYTNGSTNNTNNKKAANDNTTDFVADFGSADIFSASNSQFNNNNNSNSTNSQPSFANFDNNVIFNSATQQSSYDLLMKQLTQMPKYITHRWHVTQPSTINTPNALSNSPMNKSAMPPSEDRYAALKDLDNALKTQHHVENNHVDWNSGSNNCNGSGYASPSQSSSLYGSPSTTGSLYGSPSQNHFGTFFPQELSNNVSNPFSAQPTNATVRSPWTPNGNSTVIANNFQTYGVNPFRPVDNNGFNNGVTNNKFNGSATNGFTTNGNQIMQQQQHNTFQHHQQQNHLFTSSQNFSGVSTKPWSSPNPFALGVSPGNSATHSNNPFL